MKSMLRKRILPYALGLLVVAGAVGLLTGCGDLPTAPLNTGDDGSGWVDNDGKYSNDGGEVALSSDGLKEVEKVEKEVEKLVGILGGTLDAGLGSGPTKLVIPPGALGRTVEIEMEVRQGKANGRFYTLYDFDPDGLVFKQPSKLTLTLPYTDGTLVTLRWFNPESRRWEWQESQPVKNNKVVFSIRHFSKYGIS